MSVYSIYHHIGCDYDMDFAFKYDYFGLIFMATKR